MEAHDPPIDRIVATFAALDEWMDRENERGCAMVNAYAEPSVPEHPGRTVAQEQKHRLRDLYRTLVARNVTGLADAALTAKEAARTLLRAHGADGPDQM